MLLTYDIREAWIEKDCEGWVRVSAVFSCEDENGYKMDVNRVMSVKADGSDIMSTAKWHSDALKMHRNLVATYKGMIPK